MENAKIHFDNIDRTRNFNIFFIIVYDRRNAGNTTDKSRRFSQQFGLFIIRERVCVNAVLPNFLTTIYLCHFGTQN